MSELFILQNQDNLFLNKQKDWVDGRDLNSLFKTTYKDEAINQMVEVSSKDYRQRIKVLQCSANEKGLPNIDPEIMPDPLPKAGKDLFAELETAVPVAEVGFAGSEDEIEIVVVDEPLLDEPLAPIESIGDDPHAQEKSA